MLLILHTVLAASTGITTAVHLVHVLACVFAFVSAYIIHARLHFLQEVSNLNLYLDELTLGFVSQADELTAGHAGACQPD